MDERTSKVFYAASRIVTTGALASRVESAQKDILRYKNEAIGPNFTFEQWKQLDLLLGQYAEALRVHRQEMYDALRADYPG